MRAGRVDAAPMRGLEVVCALEKGLMLRLTEHHVAARQVIEEHSNADADDCR